MQSLIKSSDEISKDSPGRDLVHVCDGYAGPSEAELAVLCQEAVLIGLSFIGLVRLIPADDDIGGILTHAGIVY